MTSPRGRADRVIRGRRVATQQGIRPAAIHIAGGLILSVSPYDDVAGAGQVIDAGEALVFPGLVDTHVHVNEPGRTEWEGFATATAAAAAGGVTTILDMPLNSVPATTTVVALEAKRSTAPGQCAVDVGFLGGVVPGNTAEIAGLHSAGVFAFKCFLVPSGVDEFEHVSERDLRDAAPVLAARDALLMAHCESPDRLLEPRPGADPRRHATWLATRPVEAETDAVRLLIAVARKTDLRVHVVHVSAPATLDLIREARAEGARITAETCPHYLCFSAEDVPDGATEYKCAPPIREAALREGLWAALARGEVDLVVSDHSPAPPALKLREEGDFLRAWGGIASVQLRLAAVWTEARERGHGADRLVEWLCAGPARLVGLEGKKGVIREGADADLVLWRPDETFEMTEAMLRHRHPLTPYLGRRLAGVIEATYLRGEPVYRRREPSPPRSLHGRLLSRADS